MIRRVCGTVAVLTGLALPLAAGQSSAPALERFTVTSDGHPIAVWARKPAQPAGAVLFVHGRTWSARPDFDLQVPGLSRSVLTSFAAKGFAAYALDLRGYGATPRDQTGWLTPKRSALDIVNVLAWIGEQHASLPKPTLVGWSRGAAMSAMAAQTAPAKLANLVMFGFAFDPDLKFANSEAPDKPARDKNTAASAESDFISPAVTPPVVIKAFVEQAMKTDPVLVDVKEDAEFNGFVPGEMATPTLLMFGSNDPGVPSEDAGKMFARLASKDKQMVVLPGADHAAHLEDTHDAWVAAVINFIKRPAPKR
jgi:pimeloyl-ACP methyl ester carboxylesterase